MSVFAIPGNIGQFMPMAQMLNQGQGSPRNLPQHTDILGALLGGSEPDDGGAQAGAVAPTQVSTFGETQRRGPSQRWPSPFGQVPRIGMYNGQLMRALTE